MWQVVPVQYKQKAVPRDPVLMRAIPQGNLQRIKARVGQFPGLVNQCKKRENNAVCWTPLVHAIETLAQDQQRQSEVVACLFALGAHPDVHAVTAATSSNQPFMLDQMLRRIEHLLLREADRDHFLFLQSAFNAEQKLLYLLDHGERNAQHLIRCLRAAMLAAVERPDPDEQTMMLATVLAATVLVGYTSYGFRTAEDALLQAVRRGNVAAVAMLLRWITRPMTASAWAVDDRSLERAIDAQQRARVTAVHEAALDTAIACEQRSVVFLMTDVYGWVTSRAFCSLRSAAQRRQRWAVSALLAVGMRGRPDALQSDECASDGLLSELHARPYVHDRKSDSAQIALQQQSYAEHDAIARLLVQQLGVNADWLALLHKLPLLRSVHLPDWVALAVRQYSGELLLAAVLAQGRRAKQQRYERMWLCCSKTERDAVKATAQAFVSMRALSLLFEPPTELCVWLTQQHMDANVVAMVCSYVAGTAVGGEAASARKAQQQQLYEQRTAVDLMMQG